MDKKFEKFVEAVKKGMGDMFVDTVDQLRINGQFAFVTTEVDPGENAKGQFVDLIEDKLEENGLVAAMMPYPVEGKLIYVVAGIR